MTKRKLALIIILLSSLFWSRSVSAQTIAQKLSGRILLQVESRGEAWYVSVKDNKKYYLGKPDDAYALIKKLSLGISEQEFASWSKGGPAWAKGGLFIRPQSHGEAYYVSFDGRWNYLGQPIDAWQLFRNKGLGISNYDLAKIPTALLSNVVTNPVATNVNQPVVTNSQADHSSNLLWSYGQKNYSYLLPLNSSLYSAYSSSQKAFYYSSNISETTAREKFYALFFNKKSGDDSLTNLISYANRVATDNSWSDDKKIEFLMAIIQYIPYDSSKINDNPLQPNYPYETLYKDSGICSDKTFLAVAILRELGYGAAILDFPDQKHSAAGISCPVADSVNGSGYCYIETTNYFPLGVVPPSISGGKAISSTNNLTNLFDATHLSRLEIYQKTTGKTYYGVSTTKKIVNDLVAKDAWLAQEKTVIDQKNAELSAQKANLTTQKAQLDAYQAAGNVGSYNSLVGTYNTGVNSYNSSLAVYRERLNAYNTVIKEYNDGIKALYQQ
jgi:hypothetical protein